IQANSEHRVRTTTHFTSAANASAQLVALGAAADPKSSCTQKRSPRPAQNVKAAKPKAVSATKSI
uniref:Uncharacterized protein n=1 Tax=Globisporangium ultimum (strain ATCC 200006 / CBS 805.95 / DAOM BR144) TaxID=431595 RepID=K3XBU1_GLOUD